MISKKEFEKGIEDENNKPMGKQLSSLRWLFGDKFVDAWVSAYASDENEDEDVEFPSGEEEEES